MTILGVQNSQFPDIILLQEKGAKMTSFPNVEGIQILNEYMYSLYIIILYIPGIFKLLL